MKTKNVKKELKTGTYGTTALVTGILGLLLLPIVFSPLAIVFGAIGRSKLEKYSTAGLVMGIIGFMWVFFWFTIVFAIISTLFASI